MFKEILFIDNRYIKVIKNNFLNFSRKDEKAVVQPFLASLRLGAKSKKIIDNHLHTG